jgi:hypothetical protein
LSHEIAGCDSSNQTIPLSVDVLIRRQSILQRPPGARSQNNRFIGVPRA